MIFYALICSAVRVGFTVGNIKSTYVYPSCKQINIPTARRGAAVIRLTQIEPHWPLIFNSTRPSDAFVRRTLSIMNAAKTLESKFYIAFRS